MQLRRNVRARKFSQAGKFIGSGAALLLGFGVPASQSHAQSASAWNKRGETAESKQDYDTAFEDFRQAHLKKPKDLRYRTRYERLRFQAANMHVDRGRVLRQSGDIQGAINEFARSLQIDPGNETASQELQLTEQKQRGAAGAGPQGATAVPGPAATGPGVAGPGVGGPGVAGTGAARPGGPGPGQTLVPGAEEQSPYQQQVQSDIASMAAPVALQPVSDDAITLHMVGDTKDIYQAIGKAAGLNVIFDPDYTSKRIPVDLTSVSLRDALRIVGVMSATFWKPVTTNTIFVAQNTRAKRTDLDELAVQTFYLSNATQQNDANEILVALRNLMDPSVKLYLVASQNAIVMRGTPDELILAEKLINDLDRTKPEVVVDVAVLEVSRSKERDLGITLPTSFGLTPQSSNANTTSSSTSTTTTSTSTSGVTLNTLANLNATNFAVTLSGGTVNALLSDSDTRILQNPRIRATDGQEAQLKIGSKIPVATGSTSSTLTTTALSTTQFTYLDVGVNIDITPTVHYNREISLKLKVEISSESGQVNIDTITEPVISQRVAQQVIELKDGEPSILAGLLQQQDTLGVNGTPGLGEIPFLKYFFSSQDKTVSSDEIVFLLIPHIVRESLLTDENTRAVATGTSQAVELMRRDPSQMLAKDESPVAGQGGTAPVNGQPTTAANAASAMLGKMAADARPLTPEALAAAHASAGAGTGNIPPPESAMPPVTVSVTPASANQPVGSTFQVSVVASNAHDLFSVPLQMQFDPKVLSLINVDSGDLLSRDMQAVALVHRDEGNGAVTISASRPPGTQGVSGQGTVCTLTFKALAPGDSSLALTRIGLRDSHQNVIPSTGVQAVVHVK